MEPLVVVVETASPSWTSDWDVLSIQGTQFMQAVAPQAEDRLNRQPVLWACGARHHLISIGPDDSIADLRHKFVDGRPGHPEGILHGGVAVSTGQVSEGDCQFDSWTQGLSHPGPLPLELRSVSLLELLKELRWHLDEVSVCHTFI